MATSIVVVVAIVATSLVNVVVVVDAGYPSRCQSLTTVTQVVNKLLVHPNMICEMTQVT